MEFPTISSANRPERHVVLVSPDIHWNTGNIGRTCLASSARLHLIQPIGFSLDDRYVKRAGLDYWKNVDLTIWKNFDQFRQGESPQPDEFLIFSKSGRHSYLEMPRAHRLFLIFGSETRGLPTAILTEYGDSTYHIPISSKIRSLNLSTTVGIALYESLRPYPSFHAWAPLY